MKISNILNIIAVGVALLGATTACDIDIDDRYIEIDKIEAKRAVLLEEFTGQECRNCPEGHEIVSQLKQQYGDAFIPVSIHASQLSYLDEDYKDMPNFALGIKEGGQYYSAAKSPALPAGVVDRNSGALDRDRWASAIRAELEKEAPAAIEIIPTLSPDSEEINIAITLKPTENIDCRLTVWIIESGIVGYQNDNGNIDMNYVHNHVLRAVVSEINGDKITASRGVFTNKDYTYSIKANNKSYWNKENLSVVAFIADDANGVLQAAEAAVKTE
ncbi:MAG: Omp28 family outer membrane lipoprotein [Muribaculaceae bacterium]|nr:Omp28 family outer membrane lipoprotein [Muribaculaceae bacterium]